MLKKPSLAEQLPNGLIMVNDDYRNRVVAIDPRYDTIVWQYGLTDVAGTAPGLLDIPDGFDLLLADGTTPTHPQTGEPDRESPSRACYSFVHGLGVTFDFGER